MKIRPDSIYLTDNGAAYCGEHLGTSARMTGRDISGQPIYRVTEEDAMATLLQEGRTIRCEMCGKSTSLLVAV
jgi:hypothetical protein